MAIDLKDLPKLLETAVDTISKKRTLTTVGKKLVPRIQKRIRIGKGVSKNLAAPHSLPVLKSKTKSNRNNLKKRGQLTGPGARPAKSGLNRSGDLVDNIGFKSKTNELDIGLKDKKQKDKMNRLVEQDVRFQAINISLPEFKFMLKEISVIVERTLRRLF